MRNVHIQDFEMSWMVLGGNIGVERITKYLEVYFSSDFLWDTWGISYLVLIRKHCWVMESWRCCRWWAALGALSSPTWAGAAGAAQALQDSSQLTAQLTSVLSRKHIICTGCNEAFGSLDTAGSGFLQSILVLVFWIHWASRVSRVWTPDWKRNS